MDLFLLRHGIAEERFDGLDHPERALTCEGLARTAAVARSLVKRGVQVDLLLTSPFRRALETAQIAMDAGLASELRVEAALEPGGSVEALVRNLSGRVCLVGHEPDLSSLAARLLQLPPAGLTLKKAGLLQLRRQPFGWELRALLRPGLLLDPSA